MRISSAPNEEDVGLGVKLDVDVVVVVVVWSGGSSQGLS